MKISKRNDEILNVIKGIATAKTEMDVKLLTERVIHRIGGQCFIYSTLRPNKYSQKCDLYHYFEDCPSTWRAIYDQRKWFMNDPFIEYAKSNTEVVASSNIKAKTSGQAEMLAAAAEHGFRSGIIVPTHSSLGANEWLGILVVGSSVDSLIGEDILLANRITYRALAMELMDWWKARFKNDAICRFKIQEHEINIMQQLGNGKTVSEIGAIMDLKSGSLYRHINTLKDKLNAIKTQDIIQKAKLYGLVS